MNLRIWGLVAEAELLIVLAFCALHHFIHIQVNRPDLYETLRPEFITDLNKFLKHSNTIGTCFGNFSILGSRYDHLCANQVSSENQFDLHEYESNNTKNYMAAIEVSIIMPFRNQGLMTCKSMHELFLDASRSLPVEAILIDDASEMKDLQIVKSCSSTFSKMFNIKTTVISNNSPKGYGFSCTRAADKAQGEFLLFANNDMFAGDGAILTLRKTFDLIPKSGIVGPVILGPDMRIQEFGGVVYNEGSAANAYRGDEKMNIDLLMAHEVDYISGACFMISRRAFISLGGFDQIYGMGYYEDTDLAMATREAGLKVILQPFSVVYHHDGSTFGSQSSVKQRLMDRNKRLFQLKWMNQLRFHTGPEQSIYAAREKYIKRQILVVDRGIPTPSHDSGSYRMWQLLQIFIEQGYQIDFLPITTVIESTHAVDLARLRFHGIRLVTKLPGQMNSQMICICPYEFVFISRPNTWQEYQRLSSGCCTNVPTVYDTVDLHFLRETRRLLAPSLTTLPIDGLLHIWRCSLKNQADLVLSCIRNHRALDAFSDGALVAIHPALELLQQETSIVQKATITYVVSQTERELLRALNIDISKVYVVPNVYPDAQIFTALSLKHAKHRSAGIFVGSFDHQPNVLAVNRLLAISKVIGEQYPDFKTHIVGSRQLPQEVINRIQAQDNIVLHGWLSDTELENLYADSACALVPLQIGAGMKGKVASAYLHAIPVIGSEISVEGMYFVDGIQFLHAESDLEFLRAYQRIRKNSSLSANLVKNGLEAIRQNFSFSQANKSVYSSLKSAFMRFDYS